MDAGLHKTTVSARRPGSRGRAGRLSASTSGAGWLYRGAFRPTGRVPTGTAASPAFELPVERPSVHAQHPCGRRLVAGERIEDLDDIPPLDILHWQDRRRIATF